MPNTIVSRPIATLTAVTLVLGGLTAVAQSPFTVAVNAPLPVDLTRDIVSDAQKRAGNVTESAGPWGLLESSYVYISAPDSVLELFPVPTAVTRWTFVGMRRADARALLDEPDVPARLRAEAADAAKWSTVGDHVQFTPSSEAVLELSPKARTRIYEVLARWEVNEFHRFPYFIPEGDVARWIGDTGLRPELIDVVKRTSYGRGRSLCFSDLPLLVSFSQSHGESRALIKGLSRTRTALLRLRLDSSANVARIREYWSSGDANAKDFLPLLESVAANPAIHTLDIVHVLPPSARKLCYTYPQVSQAVGGRYPDCHWTSLNFFNHRPEERLFDTDGAGMYVRERCKPGAGPYRFGDILFFTTAAGQAIHSCVYLADDFVFTKNGATVISPWLIMKLSDVIDRYSMREEPSIQIYRPRD
ncbi:MAG: hypothetical protein ACKOOF_03195 [Planctomycetaceae bacterium]